MGGEYIFSGLFYANRGDGLKNVDTRWFYLVHCEAQHPVSSRLRQSILEV